MGTISAESTEFSYRFIVSFTPESVMRLMTAIRFPLELSAIDWSVLTMMAWHCEADGTIDASARTIARETRLSDRSVRRSLAKFDELGLLIRGKKTLCGFYAYSVNPIISWTEEGIKAFLRKENPLKQLALIDDQKPQVTEQTVKPKPAKKPAEAKKKPIKLTDPESPAQGETWRDISKHYLDELKRIRGIELKPTPADWKAVKTILEAAGVEQAKVIITNGLKQNTERYRPSIRQIANDPSRFAGTIESQPTRVSRPSDKPLGYVSTVAEYKARDQKNRPGFDPFAPKTLRIIENTHANVQNS